MNRLQSKPIKATLKYIIIATINDLTISFATFLIPLSFYAANLAALTILFLGLNCKAS